MKARETKPRRPETADDSARCPACYSRASTIVERLRSAHPHWHVVACPACGQWFTHPRPTAEAWESLYPEDYGPHRRRDRLPRWHTAWRCRLDRWLLRLYRGYPDGGTLSERRSAVALWLAPVLGWLVDPYVLPLHGERMLLDIGCGTGEYLARMRPLGWEVLGIDRSPHAAERARKRHGIPVVRAAFPSDEVPAGPFDLITLWQVLEHLDRPRLALASIRRLLRPGGRLVLTVPNQAGWAARTFGPAWIGLDLPRHLTHFTPQSLRSLLIAEGFRIVHQSTIRHSSWVRHSARRAKTALPAHWHWLLRGRAFSRAASFLAQRRGQGESIYAVCQPA